MGWQTPPDDVFRFQELASADEGENLATNGVPVTPLIHNSNYYPTNPPNRSSSNPGWVDDDLVYDTDYGIADTDDYPPQLANHMQLSLQEQEELLAHQALDRIRRAKLNGLPKVTLSHEEIEALDLHRFRAYRDNSLRNPPKSKAGSPAKNGVRSKKPAPAAPSSLFTNSGVAGLKQSKPGRRRPSITDEVKQPTPQPPGFLVQGLNGQPFYTPIGYDSRAQPRPTRSSSMSRSRSDSTSSQHKISRKSTPVSAYEPPGAFPTFSPLRPASSSSRHSAITSDSDWNLRSRSSSSASFSHAPLTQSTHYPGDSFVQTQEASVLQSQLAYPTQSRRHVPSTPDVTYTTMPRRVPIGGARFQPHNSDTNSTYTNGAPHPSAFTAGSLEEARTEEDVKPVETASESNGEAHRVHISKSSGASSTGVQVKGKGPGKAASSGKGKHRKGKR